MNEKQFIGYIDSKIVTYQEGKEKKKEYSRINDNINIVIN